jgi:hypothetical protein
VDRLAAREQLLDEVPPDEAGRAGDEVRHGFLQHWITSAGRIVCAASCVAAFEGRESPRRRKVAGL